MRGLRLRILVWLLPVVILGAGVPAAAQAVTFPHLYTIGGRRYLEANVTVARYIPGLPTGVKAALSLLSKCPSLGANLFVSTSHPNGGAVAYAPSSLRYCQSVVGGGGGPSSFSPCISFFHTTDPRFPYAVVTGSSIQTCIDLAFEVPGGVTVTLNTEAGPAQFVVKSQHYVNGYLVDYLSSPPARIPSSQTTFALYDTEVGIGRNYAIPLF